MTHIVIGLGLKGVIGGTTSVRSKVAFVGDVAILYALAPMKQLANTSTVSIFSILSVAGSKR